MRLSGGNESAGLLEVFHNGVWGTVLDHWNVPFTETEATVVCRMLGYEHGEAHHDSALGRGKGPVWLYDVRCEGDEHSIFDCSSNRNYWGNHENDVGVSCQGQLFFFYERMVSLITTQLTP